MIEYLITVHAQCLQISEKVAFNIASEASYVYILSRQKFIENAKKSSILASFWKPEVCGQTVLPDILSNFQAIWILVFTFGD